MKKKYIKPETTAVCIKIENMIATSPTDLKVNNTANPEEFIQNSGDFDSREVIQSSDAWEEW